MSFKVMQNMVKKPEKKFNCVVHPELAWKVRPKASHSDGKRVPSRGMYIYIG